ncbi:M6 family metalloprotease domain-containing protein, partial [Enterococcus ureasiticus]
MKRKKGSWEIHYFYFIGVVWFLLLGLSPMIAHGGVVDPKLGEISFEQPNGVTFKGELKGNEFLHYVVVSQTSEVLIQESDSYWYYAKKSTANTTLESTGKKYQIDQKPKNILEEKDIYLLTIQPNENDRRSRMKSEQASLDKDQNILVVMVEFSNQKLYKSDTEPVSISEWRNKFFGENPEDKTLKTYYKEATQDRINIMPAQTSQFKEETGIVKVSLDEEHPSTNYQIKFPDQSYMEKALQKAEEYIDLSIYDKNHDGRITSNELHVLFIFAGFEITHAKGNGKSIWGHKSHNAITSNKGLVFSDGYMATGELIHVERNSNPSGGSSSWYLKATPTTIGVFAHEFGHSLGLPDLYGSENSIQGYGIGYHSTMSSGYWGKVGDRRSENPKDFPGATPAHFDAYSKMKLGLPTETITEKKEILMKSGDQPDSKIYKLPVYKEGENRPSEKHYFLIENRKIYGFDEGRKVDNSSEGISIYAVNEEYKDNLNILEYGKQIVTLKEANEGLTGYPSLSKGPGSGKDSYFKQGLNELFDFDTKPSNKIVEEEQPKFAIRVNDVPSDTMKVKFEDSSVLKGVFGTTRWTFNEKTHKLIFKGGTFPDTNIESKIKTEVESILAGKKIKKIVFTQPVRATRTIDYLFSNLSELEEIEGLEKIDVSGVTSLEGTFSNTPQLTKFNLNDWDTSRVSNFIYTFSGATKVDTLDLSNWNMRNISNAYGIFERMEALDTIILGPDSVFRSKSGQSNALKLPGKTTEPYTGYWHGPSDTEKPTEIYNLTDYDGSRPGKYEREKTFTKFSNIQWEWKEDTQTLLFKDGKKLG